ncbi:MAG: AAA family ATPase [Oscillospiraceae bacterium]|jgi:ABC-type transport system involved in cytochrome c biogenesis ATPase subunit|nr:AAA family ATPase [Oscillospiraceae bacterium]
MAVNRVEIKDFLVFKGEFAMDFCPSVNVFIGNNGTGKTTLLKAMYENIKTIIGHRALPNIPGKIVFDIGQKVLSNVTEVSRAVYIPEKDILEHAKGLLTFVDQKDNDFSSIYRDVLITAQDSDNKNQTDTQKAITATITGEVGGRVEWAPSEGRYYTVHADGTHIPFSNEASGFKKLGYLELLVRTGHLEHGSVLFWDEPENSLNPELVPILVDVLLMLSQKGVQIFIATHSDFLCKWLELKTSDSNSAEIKFFSLYKEGVGISAETSKNYRSLIHNSIIEQSIELYNEHLRRATEHDED